MKTLLIIIFGLLGIIQLFLIQKKEKFYDEKELLKSNICYYLIIIDMVISLIVFFIILFMGI